MPSYRLYEPVYLELKANGKASLDLGPQATQVKIRAIMRGISQEKQYDEDKELWRRMYTEVSINPITGSKILEIEYRTIFKRNLV